VGEDERLRVYIYRETETETLYSIVLVRVYRLNSVSTRVLDLLQSN
jgi:hypothetical protein